MKKKLFALILTTALLAGCNFGGTRKKKNNKSDNVVTSVRFNRTELNFNLNEDNRYTVETLIATVEGSGEYDSSLTWSTSDDSVAKVENGVVNAVGLGDATITAVSVSNKNAYATCAVNVINDIPVISSVSITPEQPVIDLYTGSTVQLTAIVSGTNNPSQQVSWTAQSSGVLSVDSNGLVTASKTGSGTIKATSTKDTSKYATVTVNVVDSTPRVNSVEIQPTASSYTLDLYTSGQKTKQFTANVSVTNGASQGVLWESSNPNKVSVDQNGLVTALQFTVSPVTITCRSTYDSSKTDTVKIYVNDSTPKVSSVSVSVSSTVKLNSTTTATETVYGENISADQKKVTWSSSNSSIAQIDPSTGVITGKSVGGPVTITATSNFDSSKTGSASISVVEAGAQDAYTVMMYICGSDLESGSNVMWGGSSGGEASSDIKEILAATQSQPDDVNIIMETGGASKWGNVGSVTPSATKLERYAVKQNVIEKVGEDTTANNKMSTTSALQSFIEWGINNYPADKMALIFWDHGDGIFGCCYDENNNDDCLIPTEITSALNGAFKSTGFNEKFEWIGYDCCLKQNADELSINCDYAHYEVAAQISEAGEGWYYTPWINALYQNTNIATSELLTTICDEFVKYYGNSSDNDQTLSWVYLDRMSTFTDAFNEFTSSCNSQSYYDGLVDKIDNILDFESDMGCYDMEDTLQQLGAVSNSTVMNALHNLVGHVAYYSKASKYSSSQPSGVNSFIATCDEGDYVKKSYYSADATKFTNWRLMNINYGFESVGGW